MVLFVLSFCSFLGWAYLAVLRRRFWQPVVFAPAGMPKSWPDVDIVVPARDEAASLPETLPALLRQDYPGGWRVILVDDHSRDGTADIAKRIALREDLTSRLVLVAAPDLPAGWSGKVAAMQAGVAQSRADYVMFTDADILHARKDSLRRLVGRAKARDLALVSWMVKLHSETFAERLLIPAFVFFFAMLYPFRAANDPENPLAAAAGGAMLVERKALENAGGLERIKGALIDDCSLARIVKHHGGEFGSAARIELSLSSDAKSLRVYSGVDDIWRMIARTAFTQLGHATWRLAGCVAGMTLLFLLPPLLPLVGDLGSSATGLAAWAAMTALYMPMVRFYGLSPLWALTLPVAAVIYIAATVDSARLHWRGRGGQWKGRTQGGRHSGLGIRG